MCQPYGYPPLGRYALRGLKNALLVDVMILDMFQVVKC